MNKTKLFIILAAILTGSMISACGSGGTNTPNSPQDTAIKVESAPIPNSYTPVGTTPAPVAISVDASSIAVPVDGTYVTYSIPPEVSRAVLAIGESNVVSSSDGNDIVLTLPDVTYILSPAVSIQTDSLRAPSTMTVESYNTSGANTNVLRVPGIDKTPAGVLFGKTDGNIVIQPANSSHDIPLFTLLNLCPKATGIPSAIHATIYRSIVYLAVGSTTGSICVLKSNDLTFNNITESAPNRYNPGLVATLSFANVRNTLFGYTHEILKSSSVIYRITANADTKAQSLWNVTSPNQQISGNGTKLTFTNVPPTIASMYVDKNNTLFVGTNTGSVYKLSDGFTKYISTQLDRATNSVHLSATNSGIGALASTTIDGSIKVFTVKEDRK